MQIRTFAVAFVLAAAAAVPMSGVAFAQDRNCSDFDFQEDAQAALRDGDPDNLDDDDDGEACETLPRRGSSSGSGASDNNDDDKSDDNGDDDKGQVKTKPKGSVDTGDGSSTPDPAPVLALAGIAAAAGVTAAAARRATRTTR